MSNPRGYLSPFLLSIADLHDYCHEWVSFLTNSLSSIVESENRTNTFISRRGDRWKTNGYHCEYHTTNKPHAKILIHENTTVTASVPRILGYPSRPSHTLTSLARFPMRLLLLFLLVLLLPLSLHTRSQTRCDGFLLLRLLLLLLTLSHTHARSATPLANELVPFVLMERFQVDSRTAEMHSTSTHLAAHALDHLLILVLAAPTETLTSRWLLLHLLRLFLAEEAVNVPEHVVCQRRPT